MLTLGLAGGLDPVYDNFLDSPDNYTYDGAAVLVKDGKVIAAIEEERLDRIKRSNKFPLQAIQFCLEAGGIGARDLDRIAYYVDERDANALLSHLYLHRPDIEPKLDARSLFAAMLGRGLGVEVDAAKLRFYPHCLMHGIGVMDQSGFEESLVLVIDEVGGMFRGQREKNGSVRLYPIADLPPAKSLGRFWGALFPFFGYGNFDEYKVMMLAPYGDPDTYQEPVGNLYDLLPNGDYLFHLDRVRALIGKIEPRRRDQEPAQAHRDLAASLQAALERIVLHVVRHHREATGQRNLCIAGGMAENSVTNGKVLQSNLFDRVFVHPAAYDAGCALGAALAASYEQPARPRVCRSQVYWGVDVGEDTRIAKELGNWSGPLTSERVPNVADYTARLIEQ
jgi:carbamoyltransferase